MEARDFSRVRLHKSLASTCPESTIGEGLAVRGSDAQNDQDNVRSMVNDWIAESG